MTPSAVGKSRTTRSHPYDRRSTRHDSLEPEGSPRRPVINEAEASKPQKRRRGKPRKCVVEEKKAEKGNRTIKTPAALGLGRLHTFIDSEKWMQNRPVMRNGLPSYNPASIIQVPSGFGTWNNDATGFIRRNRAMYETGVLLRGNGTHQIPRFIHFYDLYLTVADGYQKAIWDKLHRKAMKALDFVTANKIDCDASGETFRTLVDLVMEIHETRLSRSCPVLTEAYKRLATVVLEHNNFFDYLSTCLSNLEALRAIRIEYAHDTLDTPGIGMQRVYFC